MLAAARPWSLARQALRGPRAVNPHSHCKSIGRTAAKARALKTMHSDPPEQAILAMLLLFVLAVGLVWLTETLANWLR